jgi:hypothetical protein
MMRNAQITLFAVNGVPTIEVNQTMLFPQLRRPSSTTSFSSV